MDSTKDLDIRHFKLTNGDDLLCYVQTATEHAFVVERPAAVQVSPDGVWMFNDWFPFSDKKVFKIMKRFVINHTGVVAETKESYLRYTCQDEIRKEIEYTYNDDADTSIDYEPFDMDSKETETIH